MSMVENENFCFSGGRDGTICLWDVETKSVIASKHRANTQSIQFFHSCHFTPSAVGILLESNSLADISSGIYRWDPKEKHSFSPILTTKTSKTSKFTCLHTSSSMEHNRIWLGNEKGQVFQ